jgi:hypothetical protein
MPSMMPEFAIGIPRRLPPQLVWRVCLRFGFRNFLGGGISIRGQNDSN